MKDLPEKFVAYGKKATEKKDMGPMKCKCGPDDKKCGVEGCKGKA